MENPASARQVSSAPSESSASAEARSGRTAQDCSRVQGGYFAQATCLKVLVCSRGQARYIPQAASAVSDSVQLSDSHEPARGRASPILAALKLRECVGFLARATQPRAPRTDPRSCPTRSAKRGAPRPRLGSRRALDVMLTGVLHQVAPRGGRRKRPRGRQDWKTRHPRPFTTWSST